MTVYIVQEVLSNDKPIYDTSTAERFGERRVLYRTSGYAREITDENGAVTHRRARPFHSNADRDEEAVRTLQEKLSDYGSGDYLLPTGSIKLIAVAAAIAAHRTGGRLDLLLWDGRAKCYEPSSVQLWEEDEEWTEERMVESAHALIAVEEN